MRKTFPGTRMLAAGAVRAGGGVMHRLGLSESLLVFPEHRALLPAGADVLQLERFAPDQVAALKASLRAAGLRCQLAPAGGVTLHNGVAYARAGADLLVSSAPYLAPPADIRVEIGPA